MDRVTLSGGYLSRIDFGAPSAERYIERGLDSCFLESEAFERVQSGSRRIVIGNRGSGKSAIFQVLAQREREAGSYVIELSPADYSYELLSQTMTAESSGSWAKLGAYAVAWKYLIYVLILREVSRRRVALKKAPPTPSTATFATITRMARPASCRKSIPCCPRCGRSRRSAGSSSRR